MIGYEEEETKTDGRVCKTTYKTELVEIVREKKRFLFIKNKEYKILVLLICIQNHGFEITLTCQMSLMTIEIIFRV